MKTFPDYIDYLPSGAIVRKIGVMGYLPKTSEDEMKYIALSKEEYAVFVSETINLVLERFTKKGLL